MNKPASKINKLIFSWPVLIILLFFFIVLARGALVMNQKKQIVKDQENSIFAEVSELEQKKADLEAKVGNLETELGSEEELRNRFRIVKPGEELIVIVQD